VFATLLFPLDVDAQPPHHSATVGDLRATVTAVKEASDDEIKQYGLHPRSGYRAVLVFVTFKNMAEYPSCSFLDEWLRVKQGYMYHRESWSAVRSPKAYNVPPAEESEGILQFEIKDGTEPVALKIIRNTMSEYLCAQTQHRERHLSGAESVSLSLQGLPPSRINK
jgi:hypothetical protein